GADDTHQLPLGVPTLIVQAANRPPHRARVTVLQEPRRQPGLGVALGVVALQEEPARVWEDLPLDDEDTLERRGHHVHGDSLAPSRSCSSRATSSRYCP